MADSDKALKFAKKYLEDLLTFFDLNLEVEASVEDDVIQLSVPSTSLNGFLIGQKGENLRSIQYLVGLALKSQDFEIERVNVDIADYKKQQAQRLAEQVKQWADHVKESGMRMELSPMRPADRRTVHKTVSEIDGVTSESDGEGRNRHVVILPEEN